MKTIVKAFILVYLTFFIISCQKNQSGSEFEIKRGVNLSHWLSQDFGWEPKYQFIQEKDIKFIDSIGYDHVRIPIDEFEFWDENNQPIEEAFKHLESCLNWCNKYGLKAIVDLHVLRSHHFNAQNEGKKNSLWDDVNEQNHFIKLWQLLSDRLKKFPNNLVAYELLNEAVAPSADILNNLFSRVLDSIRKLEPERTIIIGANMWQTVNNVPLMKIPENDKNIIISFHFYTPLLFTHYTANWTPLQYFKGEVHYPGMVISDEDLKNYLDTARVEVKNMIEDVKQPFNKERLYEMIKPAIEFAKSKKVRLYCGEFGCLPTVPRKDRLQYYSDLIDIFEENNIAWANWEYKGDFGIYFFDNKKLKSLDPDFEFIDTLLKYTKK